MSKELERMCGRYTVLTENEIIEVRGLLKELSFRLARDEFEIYNITPGDIRPTDYAPIISKNDDGIYLESAKWGFKSYTGTGVIFNARSETANTKPMFAESVRKKRCVVPASEYFEWQDAARGISRGADANRTPDRGKKSKKKKHHITDKHGNILYLAGVYRDNADGREYVIITKDSYGEVANIHNRMPVILKVDQIPAWLNGELSAGELSVLNVELDVSPTDNIPAPENDGGQLSLFSQ